MAHRGFLDDALNMLGPSWCPKHESIPGGPWGVVWSLGCMFGFSLGGLWTYFGLCSGAFGSTLAYLWDVSTLEWEHMYCVATIMCTRS